MKAVIIDTFNYFDIRTKYVREVLVEQGYDITMIVSDFDHITKNTRTEDREHTIFLPTKPYFKNLSLKRIRSHLDFSKKVYDSLCDIRPGLIYCLLPLNSLAEKVYKYKKKNRNTKVYFDIYDLWPESLPTNKLIKKILFPWRNLRDKHLKCADKVFSECSYYKKFLPKNIDYVVAYLCKEERKIEYKHDDGIIRFLYLGSINNIIDIDGIVKLLSEVNLQRPVHLEIVGGGEAETDFIAKLESAKVPYTNHGMIFDENEKDEITSRCHFGLNMYKKGLCIGLTMKSLDYFCRALPIINSNIYDTEKLIGKYNCGINVDDMQIALQSMLSTDEITWNELHQNVNRLFKNEFSITNHISNLRNELYGSTN